MNQGTKIGGKVEQVTGKVKEKIGETIGNQKLANEGLADQVKGAAKETWGNTKDAAKKMHDEHRHDAEEKATETRKSVVASVDNLKDKIKDGLDEKTRRPA